MEQFSVEGSGFQDSKVSLVRVFPSRSTPTQALRGGRGQRPPRRLAHSARSRRPKAALRCPPGVAEQGTKAEQAINGLASFPKNAERVTAWDQALPGAGHSQRPDGPCFSAGSACSSVFHRKRIARGPRCASWGLSYLRGGPMVAGRAGEALEGKVLCGTVRMHHREAWELLGGP